MRILSICRSAAERGGMENVFRDRAAALLAEGHDVHMLSARDGHYSDAFAEECSRACDALRPDIISLDSFDASRPWWVDRRERVALTMHSTPWSLFFTAWNQWMAGRGEEPAPSYLATKRCCELIQKADVVIAISLFEQGVLQDICGVPGAHCVYNPIAPYFFQGTLTDAPADGYFLCVGKSSGVRGFDVAQRAADAVGAPLRVATQVPREQMPATYDGCRAMLLPTLFTQGFDLTVAESLARCRPVIVSKLGAHRVDALPGMMHVPARDESSIVAAMQAAVSVPLGTADRHRPEVHAQAWLEAVA